MLRRPPIPTPFPYTTLFRSPLYDHREPEQLERRPIIRGGAPYQHLERPVRSLELMSRVLERLHLLQHVRAGGDRKSTRLNSSHTVISYAVFCLKKKNNKAGH